MLYSLKTELIRLSRCHPCVLIIPGDGWSLTSPVILRSVRGSIRAEASHPWCQGVIPRTVNIVTITFHLGDEGDTFLIMSHWEEIITQIFPADLQTNTRLQDQENIESYEDVLKYCARLLLRDWQVVKSAKYVTWVQTADTAWKTSGQVRKN